MTFLFSHTIFSSSSLLSIRRRRKRMREQKWRRWVVPKAFLSSLSFSPLLVFNLHPLPWARVCVRACVYQMEAKWMPKGSQETYVAQHPPAFFCFWVSLDLEQKKALNRTMQSVSINVFFTISSAENNLIWVYFQNKRSFLFWLCVNKECNANDFYVWFPHLWSSKFRSFDLSAFSSFFWGEKNPFKLKKEEIHSKFFFPIASFILLAQSSLSLQLFSGICRHRR